LRLDRITGIWPQAGAFGKGYMRAEKDVRKSDWVFKAHFYQDPVQPGSIGVESVMQAVKLFMIETEALPEGMRPEFESILLGHEFEWTYRGQVFAEAPARDGGFRRERTDGARRWRDDHGVGRLWVDGKKIYHMSRFGTRLRFVPREPVAIVLPVAAKFGLEPATPTGGPFRAIDINELRKRFLARFGRWRRCCRISFSA